MTDGSANSPIPPSGSSSAAAACAAHPGRCAAVTSSCKSAAVNGAEEHRSIRRRRRHRAQRLVYEHQRDTARSERAQGRWWPRPPPPATRWTAEECDAPLAAPAAEMRAIRGVGHAGRRSGAGQAALRGDRSDEPCAGRSGGSGGGSGGWFCECRPVAWPPAIEKLEVLKWIYQALTRITVCRQPSSSRPGECLEFRCCNHTIEWTWMLLLLGQFRPRSVAQK